MIAFGTGEGYEQAQVERIAEKFADYWRQQPGVKGRKSDWSATWRNWIRTETERSPPAAPRYRRASSDYRDLYPDIPG